jgi:hypothetical protein
MGDGGLTFVALEREGAARIATTIKLENATILSLYRRIVLVVGKCLAKAS